MPKRDRPYISLECTSCHHINYTTTKNPKSNPDRLELPKFCKWENKATTHKETK